MDLPCFARNLRDIELDLPSFAQRLHHASEGSALTLEAYGNDALNSKKGRPYLVPARANTLRSLT